MVGERRMPSKLLREVQREETNCGPRSEVIVDGTPNLEIQPEKRTMAQSEAEMAERGIASGQRVVQSMMVSR